MRLFISATLALALITACNGSDDCIELADTSFEVPTWYVDADGDGYGDPDTEESECMPQGADVVYMGGDCDDTDPDINPGESEVSDYWDVDENCDGDTSRGSLVDADGDGRFSDEDCDDSDASVNSGATERCDDGIDNDCDGLIDGDDTRCIDNDGDGHHADYHAPSGTGDCDDSDASINPDATEICDDIDNDCDGSVDENAEGVEYGLCTEEQ